MKETNTPIAFRPWPKSIRKPLQPKNQSSSNSTITRSHLPLLKPNIDSSNKENCNGSMSSTIFTGAKCDVKIIDIQPFEGSLGEELSSIRKKMIRLKVDKDKTEKLLKERDLMLDLQMNQVLVKGDAQKDLENQVDRLFRLKELRLSCMQSYQIRPLREKEVGKIMNQEEDQEKQKLTIDETKRDKTTTRDLNTTMEGHGPEEADFSFEVIRGNN